MEYHGLSGVHNSHPSAPPDSLDDFLADLRSNPTLAFDLNGLSPDHALASGDAGVSAGQGVFDLANSLPQGLHFQQALINPSRSAPPIMSMPDGLLGSDLLFAYKAPQQNGHYPRKHSLDSDKAVDLYSAPLTRQGTNRSSGSRGSSEDDPPYVAGPHDTAGVAKRQRRMAEKNRTAQKRYRERQKEKMADFERQVEELSGRVSALMREKANLESRNSLLERVVQLKDASEASPPQGSLDASTEELALCSSIADFRNCIFTSEPAWSSHDVRGFTDTLILQLFDAYPKELMQCMLDVSSQTSEDPFYQRVLRLVKTLGNMVLQLTMQEPKRLGRLTRKIKTNVPPDAGTLWQKCVEALKLSDSQVQRLLELRCSLFERILTLLDKRRVILQHLEEAMPKDPTSIQSLGCAHKEGYHKALDASEELRESLDQEHKEVGRFVANWYAGNILTPMQLARCAIEVYPYHQDVFAIVDLIAMQEGKESQDAFMASLTSKQDSKSLMPADSAFRMLSSVPEPGPEGVVVANAV